MKIANVETLRTRIPISQEEASDYRMECPYFQS